MPTFSNCAKGLLLVSLLYTAVLSAQQATSPPHPAGTRIYLDVVVTPKSGPPIADLQQQDFTVLDNKVRQPITTFHASGGSQSPIEVVLLVDTVNLSYERVAWERGEIDKFLRANGGRLAYPTTLAFFSDDGTQIQEGFSTDGVELSASLDHHAVGLRNIRRSSQYEGFDRFKLSMTAFKSLPGARPLAQAVRLSFGSPRAGRSFQVPTSSLTPSSSSRSLPTSSTSPLSFDKAA